MPSTERYSADVSNFYLSVVIHGLVMRLEDIGAIRSAQTLLAILFRSCLKRIIDHKSTTHAPYAWPLALDCHMTCCLILMLPHDHTRCGVGHKGQKGEGYIQDQGGRSSQDAGHRSERLTDDRHFVSEVSQRDKHLDLQDNNSSLIQLFTHRS